MVKVGQQREADCGVACLAMALHRPYEEILGLFSNHNFDEDGISISELADVMNKYGIDSFVSESFQLQSSGILLVPSLNNIGSGHFVFWDGPGKLYDPSTKEAYNINRFPLVISHIVLLDSASKNRLTRYYSEKLSQLNRM